MRGKWFGSVTALLAGIKDDLKASITHWWSLVVLSFSTGREPASFQEFSYSTQVQAKVIPLSLHSRRDTAESVRCGNWRVRRLYVCVSCAEGCSCEDNPNIIWFLYWLVISHIMSATRGTPSSTLHQRPISHVPVRSEPDGWCSLVRVKQMAFYCQREPM